MKQVPGILAGFFALPFLSSVRRRRGAVLLFFGLAAAGLASAEPWLPPGDLRLRHDLERLASAGHLRMPLTSWPLSWGDVRRALGDVEAEEIEPADRAAYRRVRTALRNAMRIDPLEPRLRAGIAANPRIIRDFGNTPRDEAELAAGLSWVGERFALNLSATAVADPFDGDRVRPDGSYLGMVAGNWMISAGWQERWWGPGHNGSLILSTNARPVPQVALQRNMSHPFESRWLSWIGPWTVTAFIGQLDDERTIDDALLFGARVVIKPLDSLEIGLSRTAQWCGDGRPCDFSAFADMLLGNDNQGVNVDPDEEPGNQLAGFDFRWHLEKLLPMSLYLQFIGEDTRQGGPEIGSWLRLGGLEFRGQAGSLTYTSHVEVAETSCREGGLGFSDLVANCAYNHGIYRTGYRYQGRAVGHALDGDGLAYTFGSTVVEPDGDSWSASIRHMEINRKGQPDIRHTLSPTPREITDLQVSYSRRLAAGRLEVAVGYSELDSVTQSKTEFTGFLQWHSR